MLYYARGVVRRALLVIIVLAGTARAGDKPGDLIEVQAAIPDAVLDLRYATKDNFTKVVLYPKAVCKLRRGVVERLAKAAKLLRAQDRRLLIWDCYRPASIQRVLWKRDKEGKAVTLPTEFDEFSSAAHRDHALKGDAGAEARRLEAAMVKIGFAGMPTEWWHFDASDSAKYPLSDEPL